MELSGNAKLNFYGMESPHVLVFAVFIKRSTYFGRKVLQWNCIRRDIEMCLLSSCRYHHSDRGWNDIR